MMCDQSAVSTSESNGERQEDQNHPASRQDPNFVYDKGFLPIPYWSDWICELANDNTVRIKNASRYDNRFLTSESVQLIFTVCVRLRLPHDVRYLSAVIFEKPFAFGIGLNDVISSINAKKNVGCKVDYLSEIQNLGAYVRFMSQHIRQVFGFLCHLDTSNQRLINHVEKVETNIARQVTLRMVTAIQIASKYTSYHNSLSSNQVVACLRSIGFAYTQKAVLKSEMRILKTLNYQLPTSPAKYAESLLACLTVDLTSAFHKCQSTPDPVFIQLANRSPLLDQEYFDKSDVVANMDMDTVWQHVLLLLDIVMIHHDRVYQHLISSLGVQAEDIGLLHLERVKADYMLLGNALVMCAVRIVHDVTASEQVLVFLNNISNTPSSDIFELTKSILQVTVDLDAKDTENHRQ